VTYPLARDSQVDVALDVDNAVIDLRVPYPHLLPDPVDGPRVGITTEPTVEESLEEEIRRRIAEAMAASPTRPRPFYESAKRALDVVVASVLLLVTGPVIGLLALIIRLESRGPAVFRQTRVGRDGRLMSFCKFRTMYTDARERFPELYDYQFTEEEFARSYYKPSVDPRNTPFGRAFRKTTLDELPNLFNVLKGDVSLVGPRPELPDLVRYYTPEQLLKFSVKSGITGLAQVSGRNNLTIQQQIDADLEYVRRRSFAYDLGLILRTAVMVGKRVGAE
jgi:lipopolysaccharide/colanic/teichoic acid biosynthesis glycosyltransferase